jgi:hypothetical protein
MKNPTPTRRQIAPSHRGKPWITPPGLTLPRLTLPRLTLSWFMLPWLIVTAALHADDEFGGREGFAAACVQPLEMIRRTGHDRVDHRCAG